jgi:Protein of unknown function (DUF3311)
MRNGRVPGTTDRAGGSIRDERRVEKRCTKREERSVPTRWDRWYWLLIIPLVALVWVPFFNRVDPAFFGIPFFYWYQLAWVPISAVLTAIVYVKTTRRSETKNE